MAQRKNQSHRVNPPEVGIIMGSASDIDIMAKARNNLESFGIASEVTVVSAHRTPQRMFDYAQSAEKRGLKVIIAGAGGAAHLPGMVASLTTLPVIGVPIKSQNSIEGIDSLLSIVQMPDGITVATVAVNGAGNAGLLAAQILAISHPGIRHKLLQHKEAIRKKTTDSLKAIRTTYGPSF